MELFLEGRLLVPRVNCTVYCQLHSFDINFFVGNVVLCDFYYSEKTSSLPSLPKIREVAAWDGKDAPEELISEEEFSLDELMSD